MMSDFMAMLFGLTDDTSKSCQADCGEVAQCAALVADVLRDSREPLGLGYLARKAKCALEKAKEAAQFLERQGLARRSIRGWEWVAQASDATPANEAPVQNETPRVVEPDAPLDLPDDDELIGVTQVTKPFHQSLDHELLMGFLLHDLEKDGSAGGLLDYSDEPLIGMPAHGAANEAAGQNPVAAVPRFEEELIGNPEDNPALQPGVTWSKRTRAFRQAAPHAKKPLAEDDARFKYDADHQGPKVVYPSLDAWIESLDEREREIVNMRLLGRTLDQCGRMYGVSRERVRQIKERVYQRDFELDVDKHLYLFKTYQLDPSVFCAITDESLKVYNYLKAKTGVPQNAKRHIRECVFDPKLPSSIKDAVRRYVDRDYWHVDGRRIRRGKRELVDYIVEKHAGGAGAKYELLHARYQEFLNENTEDSERGRFEFPNLRSFAALAERGSACITPGAASGIDIRSYDMGDYDYAPLVALLASSEFDDIECSTVHVMRHPNAPAILGDIAIYNEYELHNLLKRLADYTPGIRERVSFGRTPMISFGKTDPAELRRTQLLGLIEEMGSPTSNELACAYEERYGVRKETVMGSYFKGLSIYNQGGRYVVPQAQANEEELAFMRAELEGACVSVELVRKRFAARFSPTRVSAAVNEPVARKLGYRVHEGLFVRDDVNAVALFDEMISGNKPFSINTLGSAVYTNSVFQARLKMRIRDLSVVEYDDCSFVPTAQLLKLLPGGGSVQVVRDFIDAAYDFMQPGVPYTMHSMRKQGFDHPFLRIEDECLVANNHLFGSLVATKSVGGMLKTASMKGELLICKKTSSFTACDLLEHILHDLGHAELDDLIDHLSAGYGIVTEKPLLKMVLKRSDLVFDDHLDMAFATDDDYQDYIKEALQWLI